MKQGIKSKVTGKFSKIRHLALIPPEKPIKKGKGFSKEAGQFINLNSIIQRSIDN